MSEINDLLERRARQYRPDDDGYEAFLDRAERRHRNHRVTTVAVALVVALVGSLGAYSMLTNERLVIGAADGNFAIWPQQDAADAQLAQDRANNGDPRLTWQADHGAFMDRFINEGLNWYQRGWSNISAEHFEDGPITMQVEGYPHDECTEAVAGSEPWDCSEATLASAEVTIERLLQPGPQGVWFVTEVTGENGDLPQIQRSPVPESSPGAGDGSGPDPAQTPAYNPLAEEVREFVLAFIDARVDQSDAARDYLAPAALEAYESHEGGLDLYEYFRDAEVLNWTVDANSVPDTDRIEIVIGVWDTDTTVGENPVAREILLVGSPGDGAPILILEAERTE